MEDGGTFLGNSSQYDEIFVKLRKILPGLLKNEFVEYDNALRDSLWELNWDVSMLSLSKKRTL